MHIEASREKVLRGGSPFYGFDVGIVLLDAAEGLLVPFIAAVERLAARGVRAVATCCGFLAIYQRELAAAAPVPVATSSLLQVPQVLRMIGPDGRIGVVTINGAALGERHFECTNLPPYAVAVQAATGRPVFDAVTLIEWLRSAVQRGAYAR